ncbi:MAG TPA: thiosulfate oxidation carrier protein SoxY [Burkholderiaceae bacterium]|nr:thiosulfate oxidation carrier protein SoxY [Burkholderiaceae bacterium]
MLAKRRDVVRLGGLFAALATIGMLTEEEALAQQQAWNKAAFETKNPRDTIKALGGSSAAESKDITMTVPDIAENGAVVPVAVASRIPGTQNIYILVEKNPNTLAAGFTLPQGTEPSISTRVKMAQTSNVLAVVKANDQFYVASREVKVTLGGCGG